LERKRNFVQNQPEESYLESLHRDLALAIGNAIWGFAKIEWAVTASLGRAGGNLDHILAELSFRQRTSILKKILPELGLNPETQTAIADCINHFERLSERRNLIAHNPWMIWLDSDAREIMTEIQHYTQQKKKLDLTSLRNFSTECAEALRRFESAANAL